MCGSLKRLRDLLRKKMKGRCQPLHFLDKNVKKNVLIFHKVAVKQHVKLTVSVENKFVPFRILVLHNVPMLYQKQFSEQQQCKNRYVQLGLFYWFVRNHVRNYTGSNVGFTLLVCVYKVGVLVFPTQTCRER